MYRNSFDQVKKIMDTTEYNNQIQDRLQTHRYSKDIGNLIPGPLKEILVNLDVIAQIKKKHKLNVKSKNFADADSWWDAFWRILYREDKNNSTEFIEKTIEAGVKSIKDYPDFKDTIVDYLFNAKEGILVEIDVYSKYPEIVSRLNIAMQNAESVNNN